MRTVVQWALVLPLLSTGLSLIPQGNSPVLLRQGGDVVFQGLKNVTLRVKDRGDLVAYLYQSGTVGKVTADLYGRLDRKFRFEDRCVLCDSHPACLSNQFRDRTFSCRVLAHSPPR